MTNESYKYSLNGIPAKMELFHSDLIFVRMGDVIQFENGLIYIMPSTGTYELFNTPIGVGFWRIQA